MGSKTATKLLLLVGLSVLLASSAALIFFGSYIIHLSGNITDLYQSTHVFVPTILILLAGLILLILVLIGFFGCILEKKTLLGIFFAVLCIIFICELTALTLGLVYKSKIKSSVEDQLYTLIRFYSKEASLKNEIDYVQSTFRCCGVMNSSDWENVDNGTIPDSCCQNGPCINPLVSSNAMTFPSNANFPYKIGCAPSLEKFLKQKFLYIIIILSTIILLQIVSLIASCCIFNNKRPMDYEPFNNGFHV